MGQVLAEAHPEVQYGWTPLPRSPAHLPDFRGGGWCPARSDDGAARTHGPGNVSRIHTERLGKLLWSCTQVRSNKTLFILRAGLIRTPVRSRSFLSIKRTRTTPAQLCAFARLIFAVVR